MRSSDFLPFLGAIAFVVSFLLLVARVLAQAHQEGRPLPRKRSRQFSLFVSGLVLLWIALALPAHSVLTAMISHMLLAFFAAPLLLLGLPRATLLPLFEHARARHFMQLTTRPAYAVSAFVVVISTCYLPHVLDPTLTVPALRFGIDLLLFFISLAFWWPVIEPWPLWHPEFGAMGKILYLFIGSTALKVPGFILAIVPRTLYQLPPRTHLVFGLTPLEDQQFAGWMLVLAGTFVLLAAASVVCFQMMNDTPDMRSAPVERRIRQ